MKVRMAMAALAACVALFGCALEVEDEVVEAEEIEEMAQPQPASTSINIQACTGNWAACTGCCKDKADKHGNDASWVGAHVYKNCVLDNCDPAGP